MFLLARHLTCRRGGRTLFQGLSIELGEGQLLEIRGGNGSGKSRLLRILAGVTSDWSGQLDVKPSSLYIGHENGLHPLLTVRENLEWAASMVNAPMDAVEKGLRSIKASHLAQRACETLSLGQSRRVALSKLVFSSAPLWILDEPTNSLDDQGRECFEELLCEQLEAGGAAVIATHGRTEETSDRAHAFIASRRRELTLGQSS